VKESVAWKSLMIGHGLVTSAARPISNNRASKRFRLEIKQLPVSPHNLPAYV
jgi:hypothetical protein